MPRQALWSTLGTLTLSVITPAAAETEVRVQELAGHLGTRVTVKGRTGRILEAGPPRVTRRFTLRDDYGDEVWVVTHAGHPTMGVTYQIEGTPERAGKGRLVLVEHGRELVHRLHWLLGWVGAIVLEGGCVVWMANRRWLAAVRQDLSPEVWGEAEVIAGAGQGTKFSLRGAEVG